MLDRYEEFTSLINKIHKNIQRIKLLELKKFGLKGSHSDFLYYLGKHKQLTFKEFCKVLNADKAFVSRNLALLREKKLIKEKSDNNRNVFILTDKGLKIYEVGKNRTEEICEKIYIKDLENGEFYKNLKEISERLTKIGDTKDDKNNNWLDSKYY